MRNDAFALCYTAERVNDAAKLDVEVLKVRSFS